MSHYTIRVIIDVLESLKVALGFFCLAKKDFCLLAFQCRNRLNCCCHNYVSYLYNPLAELI